MLLNLVANLELTEIGPVTGRVTEMLLAKLHSYNEVQNDGSEPSVEGLRPEAPHHPVDTKLFSTPNFGLTVTEAIYICITIIYRSCCTMIGF